MTRIVGGFQETSNTIKGFSGFAIITFELPGKKNQVCCFTLPLPHLYRITPLVILKVIILTQPL